MIRFENVSKLYPGGHEALSDISFEIRHGELLVLAGLMFVMSSAALAQVNPYIARFGERLAEGEAVRRRYASDEYEFYVQDSWKMNDQLTVTAPFGALALGVYTSSPPTRAAVPWPVGASVAVKDFAPFVHPMSAPSEA